MSDAPRPEFALALLTRVRAALAARYDVGETIGEGASAVVFAARDLKFHREVAIKVLRPDIVAAGGERRFLREIELAGRLSHPNIVPLFDADSVDALVYYAMPRIDGQSLRARLRRESQLPVEDALRIARDVAAALQYAHARGILHRDVKPGNILLTHKTAALADFGLARVLADAPISRDTASGLTVGTAEYMSPEQAEAAPLDGRTDQYSLGCVLYEMLVGDPPFSGHSPHAVRARHRLDPPPSIRAVRPSTPAFLEDVVNRMLQKIPADRFEDMGAVVEALSHVSGTDVRPNTPTQAVSVGAGRPRRSWWPVALVLAFVGAIAAVASWKVLGGTSSTVPQTGRMVFRGVENRTRDPELDAATLLFESGLRQSPRWHVLDPGEIASALEEMRLPATGGFALTDTTAREVAWRRRSALVVAGVLERFDTTFTLRIAMDAVGDRPTDQRQSWSRAFVTDSKEHIPEIVDSATRWVRSELGEAEAELAHSAINVRQATTSSWQALDAYSKAVTLNGAGQWKEAIAQLERAVQLDPEFALAYAKLGDVYNFIDMARAVPYWERALALARRLRLTTNERLAISTQLDLDGGRAQRALEGFRLWSKSYPQEYRARFGLAMSLRNLGRTTEAIEVLRMMLAADSTDALARSRLAECFLLAQEWDSAGVHLSRLRSHPKVFWRGVYDDYAGRRALLMGDTILSARLFSDMTHSGHPYWESLAYSNLASRAAEAGAAETAFGYLEEGARYDRRVLGAESPVFAHQLAMKLLGRAYLRYKSGKSAECIALSNDAIAMSRDPRWLLRAGTLLARCGDIPAALRIAGDSTLRGALPLFVIARERVSGEAALASGDTAAALRSFRIASALELPTAEREYLARALAITGNAPGAIALYGAIEKSPAAAYLNDDGALLLPGLVADARAAAIRLRRALSR